MGESTATRRSRIAACEHIHEACEDLLAVFAAQRKRELGGEDPVLQANVITAAVQFGCKIPLASGKPRERVSEMHFAARISH